MRIGLAMILVCHVKSNIARPDPNSFGHGTGSGRRTVDDCATDIGTFKFNTTAVYLQFSGQEAKAILKDRGLI